MKALHVLSVVLCLTFLTATSALSLTMTEDFSAATINSGVFLTTSSGLNQWNDLARWQINDSGGNTGAWAQHTPNAATSPEESLLYFGWDATGMGMGNSYTFSFDFINDSSGFVGHAYVGGLTGSQQISPFAPWQDLQATAFDTMAISSGIDDWDDGSIFMSGVLGADYDVLYIAIQMGGYGGLRGVDNIFVEVSESAPVPEPSTVLLLGSGLIGLAWYGRKRKKA